MEKLNQTTILKGYTPEEQLQSIGEDIKDFSPINYCPNTMISKDQKKLVVIELNYDSEWEENKKIEKVILLNSVTMIGRNTFRDFTSLQKVVIPNSVKQIDSSAFKGCTSLEEIVIPDSVTEIGRDAFNGCTSLEEIVIPESVTKIGYCAFENCKNLSLITIPKVYSSIGDVLSGYSGDLVIKSIDNNYSYEDGFLITRVRDKDCVEN